MSKNGFTTASSHQPRLNSLQLAARLPLVAFLAVASFLVIVGIVCWQQDSKVAQLKRIAGEIQPGENIFDVDVRLGKSTLCYESGWPYAGAPPTEFGALYGGPVNNLRQQVDSLVLQSFRGSPRWYAPQSFRSWPVLVQYDGDKRVTAVFVDGVETASSKRQQK